ncbi:MAG: SGNH/GDSL hydrolase family protein [Candidatus Marinimicrobia bacterium]|nr:SGNH/GDSL hydrolase family protein [Candidatus Neomarinimicrobiota bacterium]
MVKILFFGDSITAGGKSKGNPLGDGFVAMLAKLFQKQAHQKKVRVINSGVNGHTIQDLLARYKTDVVPHTPDVIVIKIGINDAYHDFMSDNQAVPLQEYEADYGKLILALRKYLPKSRIQLLTPYYISDTKTAALYLRMSQYIGVVRKLSSEYKLPVLDTQAIFDTAIKNAPATAWAADQIHPVKTGHALLAQHMYDFLLMNNYLRSGSPDL